MAARSKLDERMLDVIRRGMCTKRTEPDMASELGIGVRTVAAAKARIRKEWQQSAIDAEAELTDIYGRVVELEQAAWKERRWREARECLALRARLTGAMQPERRTLEHSGPGGKPLAIRTEIVVVDPSPAPAVSEPALAQQPEPALASEDMAALLPAIVAVDPAWPKQS